jgi:hypothetical protein
MKSSIFGSSLGIVCHEQGGSTARRLEEEAEWLRKFSLVGCYTNLVTSEPLISWLPSRCMTSSNIHLIFSLLKILRLIASFCIEENLSSHQNGEDVIKESPK